jgi:ribonuclease HII
MVVVDATTGRPPADLRDSKLLAPAVRESLVPEIQAWAHSWAVGHANAREIDDMGILRALRLAGERALALLSVRPGKFLLDGNYDWLTRPARAKASPLEVGPGQVRLEVRGDQTCASVAAASVLAKVERDRMMVELARKHPGYGWEANKGYGAPAHRKALAILGPCEQHRKSWHLVDDDETAPLDTGSGD